MVKDEIIQRSPVRVFMNSINGGLGPGELGVIASLSGIGKTSVLVQIALDKLLQGKKVIHISFTRHTEYILTWYENIFDEFIRKKNLENEDDVKDDIVKNRVLMKFTQEGISGEQILRSIKALIKDGGFNAELLIIDGFDFSSDGKNQIAAIKSFAEEMGVSIWYSCTVKGKEPFYDKKNIPLVIKDYAEYFSVVIVLESKSPADVRQDRPSTLAHIALTVSKDRNTRGLEHLALRLDPRTLLIMED